MIKSKTIFKSLALIIGFVCNSHNVMGRKLPDLIPFKEGNLFGYCDSNFNVLIKPQFQRAYLFAEDRALVTMANRNGYIDKKGNVVIPCVYKHATSFFMGHAQVRNKKADFFNPNESEDYQYINTNGDIVPAPFEWEKLKRNFKEYHLNYLQFEKDWKSGIMDKNGTIIVPAKYDRVFQVTPEGYAVFRSPGKYTLTNSEGKILLERNSDIDHIREGRFFFRDGSGNAHREGYMTVNGDTISSSEYKYNTRRESYSTSDKYDENWRQFYEGRAIVTGDKKQGYIDLDGKLVIDTIYDAAFNFKEGRAKVKRNGKYGFIDKEGNLIGEIKYDQACYFYEGRAQVIIGEKCGYINLKGELIIPMIYDYWQSERYASYHSGFLRVRINEKFGILDHKGKAITDIKYDDIWPFKNKRAIVKLDDKFGLIDEAGNEVIPPIYGTLYRIDQYAFKMTAQMDHRQQGIINLDGKILVPLGPDRPKDKEDFGPGLYAVGSYNSFSHIVDWHGTHYLK
jgi:hypothetical protein